VRSGERVGAKRCCGEVWGQLERDSVAKFGRRESLDDHRTSVPKGLRDQARIEGSLAVSGLIPNDVS